MDSVYLASEKPDAADEVDLERCIVCQDEEQGKLTSTSNGRKRIRDAASIRKDVVTKRLRLIQDGDAFVYHMTNECYKKYTMQKTLNKIAESSDTPEPTEEESSLYNYRRLSTPRSQIDQKCNPKKITCVICGSIKHSGIKKKYRISEIGSATKFLQATVYLQDEVYVRTCDLQDVNSVFGADLYYHEQCMKQYIRLYDRKVADESCESPANEKQLVWQRMIVEIESDLKSGEGFELSVIRDYVNKKLTEGGSGELMNNREVKVLLQKHFGNRIAFSYSHKANKSLMCFLFDACNAQTLAESIRNTDPVRECATKLRDCLLEYDFGLEDRFCDATDLRVAWDNINVPKLVLDFLKVLFNVDSSDSCSDGKWKQILSTFQFMFYNVHQGHKRTPLHVMNSVAIHDTCKSKTLISSFNKFGLCISYDELMRIQHDIASYTVQSAENGMPLPSSLDPNKFTIAAFDNFDHNESTLSGIGSSHDTVAVVFQEKIGDQRVKPNVSETNVVHGPKTFHAELDCQNLQSFIKPAIRPQLPDDFNPMNDPLDKRLLYSVKMKDQIWALSRLDLRDSVEIKPCSQKVPAWSGVNSVWSEEQIPVSQVSFLPLLPFPVTEYPTVYTELKNLQGLLSTLEQPNLSVTCDEGVYRIARDIQLLRPEEFQNIVLCMGSFHMTKVALGCIGKYLKGSGVQTILVESKMFGPNVVESVLTGRNYVRSLTGMQCLKEALGRLQLGAFFESNLNVYHDEITVIKDLQNSLAAKDRENSQKLLKLLQNKPLKLIDDFNNFIHLNCNSNKTFKYWNTFLDMVMLVENLIRSDREGNWGLHILTVEELLPVFAALDATNYLRWCSLYLEDMKRLPITAPDIHEHFCEGKFVVKHTKGRFKSVGADMALEQTINRSQKSQSGIIGMTRKKAFVTKWEMIYHEMLEISNLHRELSGFKPEYEIDFYHNVSDHETQTGEKNVQLLIDFILRHENPFQTPCQQTELHNIITKEVMSKDLSQEILNMKTIGSEICSKLKHERFIDKSRKISDTIHRVNIKGFHTIQKSSSEQKGKKKRAGSAYKRMVDIAIARGIPMESVLPYDVSQEQYLFDEDGFMKKAQKSTLIQQLEKNLTEEDKKPNFEDKSLKSGVVIDVMATIRRIKLQGLKTFGDLCRKVIEYARRSSIFAQRLDFVFDSYDLHSIKDCERKRRQTQGPVELSEVLGDTPLPVDMNMFWGSSKNKVKLEVLLHEAVAVSPTNVQQVVAGEIKDEKPCKSTINKRVVMMPELHSDMEEADERIALHVANSLKYNINCVVVHSPDSDVIILLLYHFSTLQANGLQQLWVRCGVGDSTRFLPIHNMSVQLGSLCSVLPAVHHLTGSDYTSKVGTKAAALKANPEQFLAEFGHYIHEPKLSESLSKAEAYLVQVLKKGTVIQTMNKLRSHLYFHSKGSNELPPTSEAIKVHILRACIATKEMLCVFETTVTKPDPTLFGYVLDNELLLPIVGRNPLPEEYTVRCGCKTCTRVSCSCKLKGVLCTRFCDCSLQEESVCGNK